MDVTQLSSVHFIGVGGINMSAVAKLLLAKGVKVSGSDVKHNEQLDILAQRGAQIFLGEDEKHLGQDVQLVVYTSAAPETNKERMEAKRRGIPELTNFQFLGEYFKNKKTVLVAGTHGKSTTTAMLGRILTQAKMDPTVVVGSKVSDFPDGNLRIGSSDLFVVEGDEYARHFLEFSPFAVVLNNIELDHTDVFSDLATMQLAFRELISKIQPGGILVANVGDTGVASVLNLEETALHTHGIRLIRFSAAANDGWQVESKQEEGWNRVKIAMPGISYLLNLRVPGEFNAANAAGAALVARELGADYPSIAASLESFTGIWRRFELLTEKDGVKYYSDYGHHPTAVARTLKAAHELFSNSRIILCFQPHHRNRTRHLFLDFVPSFDTADVLVLCEIYDVAGRDAGDDQNISSQDLVDAVIRHDADREGKRPVEYAPNPAAAIERAMSYVKPGDVVIIMGAGDIDATARQNPLLTKERAG
jgi:UDP-N-acetylmuramate--alanine ligase